jgi:hypothetical protein
LPILGRPISEEETMTEQPMIYVIYAVPDKATALVLF